MITENVLMPFLLRRRWPFKGYSVYFGKCPNFLSQVDAASADTQAASAALESAGILFTDEICICKRV